MNEKLIFLDIDGVLNPSAYYVMLHRLWKASNGQIKAWDKYGFLFFDQNCKALKNIVDETGAKIVICSTWRWAGIMHLKDMWEYRNLAGEIIDITPTEDKLYASGYVKVGDNVCRGKEIQYWIDENKFTGNYVIIDDTKDMLNKQQKYFVSPNGLYGLTMADSKKAIRILNY
jgi:hypothetical protein